MPDQVLVIGDTGPKMRIYILFWNLQSVNRNNHFLMSKQAVLFAKRSTCIIMFVSLSGRYFYLHPLVGETKM